MSSAFELAWVAERGGLSADGDPSDLDTDSSSVPALAPSPAPAVFFPAASYGASAHRSHSRAGRPGGRRGRRSNRCTDWRLVTARSVRAHSADRRPGAGHRARRPRAGPNQAHLMRMLPSGYSPGSGEPATTPPRALAKIVCTHNGDPAGPTAATYTLVAEKASLRPLFDDPARLNHRHVPGKHSVARTLAPQRHAPASQRHAGVQRRPRGGHLDHRCQPARQRRPCRSSWARRSTSSTNGGRRTPDVTVRGPEPVPPSWW